MRSISPMTAFEGSSSSSSFRVAEYRRDDGVFRFDERERGFVASSSSSPFRSEGVKQEEKDEDEDEVGGGEAYRRII